MQGSWHTRVRSNAKRVWNDPREIGVIIKRAEAFARDAFRLSDVAASALAQDAVSWVWEECRFGRMTLESKGEFWEEVCQQLYKKRDFPSKRLISLDEEIPNTEGDLDRHSSGFNGFSKANQIDYVYYNEVVAGIGKLPEKHREILLRLADGQSAIDIQKELRIPLRTVFHRIADARSFLFRQDLIGVALDEHAGIKS